jgi:hypothetical protein
MHYHSCTTKFFTLVATVFLICCPTAFAGWEAGLKTGFDTNVNRSLADEKRDFYLTAYLAFLREPPRETNLDWTMNVTLEASAYADYNDLSYGMATLVPGIIFNPIPRWSVHITPFIQAKGVSDDDQSAVAFGGKINVTQRWNQTYYTGEYVMYTDSHAEDDVYSYRETAVGLFVGVHWTSAFYSEIGYEYSHGDAFRSVGQTSTSYSGRGRSRRYSQTFNQYVIREPVDRHTVGINIGYDFSGSLFSFINYNYTLLRGDAGNSDAHTASVGMGYRF